MLYQESDIAPGVALERGYYTARTRSEVPETFKNYQRKRGLVVPLFSPDGITHSYQLRPDKPRKNGPKYETPGGISPVVDVHPRMLDEVRHGDGPLLITEGAKTGDAATSRGIPTVVLAGVWMWCVPKVKPYRLKPCFDHIRLEGREVFVAFDSDCASKAGVQDALAGLVGALAARGAVAKVIYLPDAPDGSKQGIDDYLVGGGTIKEMFMLAREFSPADIGEIRMSRDERLRAGVEDLQRRWWSAEWKGVGGHSARDVALKLMEAAKRHGKIHADGIRVVKAQGPLALEAKVSGRTLWKSLNRLEEMGFGYRDNTGRKYGETGSFVLRANVSNRGGGSGHEGKVTQELQAYDHNYLHLRAPRLMWSRPKYTPKRGTAAGTRKVRQGPKPEPRAGVTRLGKIRGAIMDALDKGGPMDINELAATLHKKRARDLFRRKKSAKGYDGPAVMLEETGIISVEDGRVSLTDGWLDALDEQRKLGGEIDRERFDGTVEEGAETIARRRWKTKSRAFREGLKQPTPPTPHWTNNPDADGAIEDLKPTGGDLSPEDTEVLEAIEWFELKHGRGSFKWSRAGAKELFYTAPGGHWPEPDQLQRISEHLEDRRIAA
jgi:hypothetical protein